MYLQSALPVFNSANGVMSWSHDLGRNVAATIPSVFSPDAVSSAWAKFQTAPTLAAQFFNDGAARLAESAHDAQAALPALNPSNYLGFSELFSVADDLCGACTGVLVLGLVAAIGFPLVGAVLEAFQSRADAKTFIADARKKIAAATVADQPLLQALSFRYQSDEVRPGLYLRKQENALIDTILKITSLRAEISALPANLVQPVAKALDLLEAQVIALTASDKLPRQDWLNEKEPYADEQTALSSYDKGILVEAMRLSGAYGGILATLKGYAALMDGVKGEPV